MSRESGLVEMELERCFEGIAGISDAWGYAINRFEPTDARKIDALSVADQIQVVANSLRRCLLETRGLSEQTTPQDVPPDDWDPIKTWWDTTHRIEKSMAEIGDANAVLFHSHLTDDKLKRVRIVADLLQALAEDMRAWANGITAPDHFRVAAEAEGMKFI